MTSENRPATRALYPGSFDPFHNGHLDIVEQATELFGGVVIGVLFNFAKDTGLFPVAERVAMARAATAHLAGVEVMEHSGLAVDALGAAGADFLVKGVRNGSDFEIEQQMAQMNYSVAQVRTVYLPCRADLSFVSSRFVREIAQYRGAARHLVPPVVADALDARFGASISEN